MATCSTGHKVCASITVLVLIFFVALPLIIIFTTHSPKDPRFAVESTVVKAYNLTSDDNILFCIINLGLRAHNPNPKKHSFNFYAIDMEVRKGKHHKLADDMLEDFSVGPGVYTVVVSEAVGLHVGLKRKIATEVRADVAAREGRVNVYMSGYVGSDYLRVTCKNVVVDFSGSNARVNQMVSCGVRVTAPNDGYYA